MRQFIIKKILLIFPSLLILSLIVFFLSKLAPGDPVISLAELRGKETDNFNSLSLNNEYKNLASELHLDLPLFYFSIHPLSYPDTLYKIINPGKKKLLKSWLNQTNNWQGIQYFIQEEQKLYSSFTEMKDSIIDKKTYFEIRHQLHKMKTSFDFHALGIVIKNLGKSFQQNNYFKNQHLEKNYLSLLASFQELDINKNTNYNLLPVFNWYGFNNQYHKWLSSALRLDFGISIIDAQKATKKISYALIWTLLYVFIAYLFSLLISIPLGLYTAWMHNSWQEKILSTVSFIFYAFPLFWLATLAVVFFTSAEYSEWLNIFPSIGVGEISSEMGVFRKLITGFPHLLLPAFIVALHSAAQGIRIVRNSTMVELKNDYFITGKAKGLSNTILLWKHIFPNAMLPIITLLVSSFPAALAGSVVMEVIFNIPGIGRLLFDSINSMDWNVVFALLIFIGLITFIFYLIGDILYAYLNPKIKYHKK